MSAGVVIAGGGLAAQRCAEALRRGDYDRPIRMICAEPWRPYDRPPLSKEILRGTDDGDPYLRPEQWYRDNQVELLVGVRAAGLDAAARRVRLAEGGEAPYDQLVIATGGRPRMLRALEEHENVSALRTLDDARALRAALSERASLAIVGAGFVGLEVAASARREGVEVTLIDSAAAPLAAVLGGRLGSWFAAMHRDEGVEVLLSDRIRRVYGDRRVEALGRHVVSSHWESAARQGARAAHAILGRHAAAAPPESFWSDQYGIRIQYLGHAALADDVTIDGDGCGRDFTAVYTRAGRPVAVLLVGRPHGLPEARRMLQGSGS